MKRIPSVVTRLALSLIAVLLIHIANAQSNIVTYPTAGETAFGRTAHRILPLPDGRLILQGDVSQPSAGTNTIEVYNPGARTFQRVGRLLVTRWQDASAVLADGRLLVVGGRTSIQNTDIIGTAELLDPVSGVTVPTGSLNIPRSLARAITLQDGRVLVAGGTSITFPGPIPLASELYDPVTGQFSLCGNLIVNRQTAGEVTSATLMLDGRVLFAGGSTPASSTAEIFNPATGTFQLSGTMLWRRIGHSATLLPDGRIVFIGGANTPINPGLTNLVEVFDPATETFSALGSILLPRRNHSATLLPNGKILVAGGWTNSAGLPPAVAHMEMFDPVTGTSEYIGDMAVRRGDHRVAALANGQVIITGGRTDSPFLRSAEIFDPLVFMRPEDLFAFYQEFDQLALENQQLLQLYQAATNMAWGLAITNSNLQAELAYANDTLADLQSQLEQLNPNPFRLLPGSLPLRPRIITVSLPDGRVLMQAGITLDNPSSKSITLFHPETESMTTAGGINEARVGHTGNLLPDGRVLFAGGSLRAMPSGVVTVTNSTEIYDASTSNAVFGPKMVHARISAGSVNLSDGRILFVGGRNDLTPFVAQAEIYEPGTGAFRLTGTMTEAVNLPTVTLLQNGHVLIFGSSTNTTPVIQIFNPATESFQSLTGPIIGRIGHQASLLPDGKVLISGGRAAVSGQILNTTEIFDPATGTFIAGPAMLIGRQNFTSTTLLDGTVLLAGGQTNVAANFPATVHTEIFDPQTGSFSFAGTMVTNQYFHAGVLLSNGTVLMAGGITGIGPILVNRAQIYDPVAHVPTSELGNLHLLIYNLEAEIEELEAQLASLHSQLTNATATITGLTATNSQLQQDLAACAAEKAALVVQINSLTNQIAQQQTTIGELTLQNNALTNQVAQLQSALAAEQSLTQALTAQLAQQAALIASLQAQNTTLTNQVSTLTQQNGQLQAELTGTQNQVLTLVSEFQTEFSDPAFTIPGSTLQQQVQNLIAAILDMNHGQRKALYRNLD